MAKQPAKGRKTPAKTTKPAETAAESSESLIVVAPRVDTIPPEVHADPASSDGSAIDTAQAPAVAPVETLPEKEAKAPEPAPSAEPEPAPRREPEPSRATPQPAPRSTGPGFLALLLGGLLAGVIGFAVATYTAPAADNGMVSDIAAQSAAIERLEQQMAELPAVAPATTDGTPQEDLTGQITALQEQLAAISDRIEALETRPAPQAVVDTSQTEAVAEDIDALRDQLAEMTAAAQTELDEARAAAASIEENAAAAARTAAAQAALARIQSAVETGAPIGAALNDLQEAMESPVPDALTAVSEGVPTLPALQESFPEAARNALAEARRAGVAGEATSGFSAFLRNQFDVRSTAPREGTDADAILSRAEDAVRTGRLADALAELGALPEVARAEMSDWLAAAESRASAVSAIDALSTSLSDN